MSALAATGVEFDPLRDKTYRAATLGPDVVAFLAWLELGGASPSTLEDYEWALGRFCHMFPATAIEDITDLQLGECFKTFSAKSRYTRVAPFRTFFKWARLTRRRPDNPMDYMPQIKRHKPTHYDIFSDAECELLLGLPTIDAAPMGLLLEAGLRRAEASAMIFRRCQPGSNYVKVVNGKGGKDRLVPMSARLELLLIDLEQFEGVNTDDHILYSRKANQKVQRIWRNRPIGVATFDRWWKRCLKEAGVRYRNPHMARHTFATRKLREGFPLEQVSLMLGHSSFDQTRVYTHSQPSDALETMREIEARLA